MLAPLFSPMVGRWGGRRKRKHLCEDMRGGWKRRGGWCACACVGGWAWLREGVWYVHTIPATPPQHPNTKPRTIITHNTFPHHPTHHNHTQLHSHPHQPAHCEHTRPHDRCREHAGSAAHVQHSQPHARHSGGENATHSSSGTVVGSQNWACLPLPCH